MSTKSPNCLESSTVLWRYLSFSRFKQLVESKELFFSRTDLFSDFREGALPAKTAEKDFNSIKAQTGNAAEAAGLINILGALNGMASKNWYASCWNENTVESNLMWRSYGGPRPADGVDFQFKVAIKTTVGNVREAIRLSSGQGKLVVNKVTYYDSINEDPFDGCDGIDTEKLCYIKPQEYRNENEVRFALHIQPSQPNITTMADMQHGPIGHRVEIDLTSFIDALYIEAVPLDRVRANDVSRERNYDDVCKVTIDWETEQSRRQKAVELVCKAAGIVIPELVNSKIY